MCKITESIFIEFTAKGKPNIEMLIHIAVADYLMSRYDVSTVQGLKNSIDDHDRGIYVPARIL